MLEAAFKRDATKHATSTGDKSLEAYDVQTCPRCGGETFRTSACVQFEPSDDQSFARAEHFDVVPIVYED